jgi:beta-glucanase (GH16 family)
MRRWRLALSVAVALGLAIWALGIHADKARPTGLDSTPPKLRSIPVRSPSTREILRPSGPPQRSLAFTGSSLDRATWATCYPYMDYSTGCTNFGNKEYQWYLASQVHVSSGELDLVAERTATPGTDKNGDPSEYNCRSGMVTTYPSLQFTYGYVQIVARIPAGPGLWPGLWLGAANLKWPPEIDMLEAWGTDKAGVFFHPLNAAVVSARISPKSAYGWHTFGLDWSKSQITWTIDGKVVLTVRHNIPHQKMYLLMDLAESVNPLHSTDCTGSLLVKSVKFWQDPASARAS